MIAEENKHDKIKQSIQMTKHMHFLFAIKKFGQN